MSVFVFCIYQCNTTPQEFKEKAVQLQTDVKNLEVDVKSSQRKLAQDSIRLAASTSRFLQVLVKKYVDAKFDPQTMKIQTTSTLLPDEERWAERELAELKDLKSSVERVADKVVGEQKKLNELQGRVTLLQDENYRNRLYRWLWLFGALISAGFTVWGFRKWNHDEGARGNGRNPRKRFNR
ncbi:MAG: hypothetical protein ACKVU2_03545 [Saprospiraceae bacterium]